MNRDLPTVVISDLDSTLFDTEHRHDLADECRMTGDWDSYSKECINDEIIPGTLATIRLLYPHHRIHLCSGRSDVARAETESILEYYKVPYDELKLYESKVWGTKPSNGELKLTYIKGLRMQGYQVVLFIEDWPETAEMIERNGVPVLCVNPRYENPLTTHL